MPSQTRREFVDLVEAARRAHPDPDAVHVVPLGLRLLADQLTPVLAYRRLVAPDERTAPSFLLESVHEGRYTGRYSIMGSRPSMQVIAYGHETTIIDERRGGAPVTGRQDDPVIHLRALVSKMVLHAPPVASGVLPDCVHGGWFGYASYDAVRYAEPEKLDPRRAPPDDRRLADVQFSFYDKTVVFDHVARTVHVLQLAMVHPGEDPGDVYDRTAASLEQRAREIEAPGKRLPAGRIGRAVPDTPMRSNVAPERYRAMIDRALEYIRAGDVFQVVLGHRFERRSAADPFEVYRALRTVNPSPYMVYLQAAGCILVASSPEILCRVRHATDAAGRRRAILTNRPLAGTRRRGKTPAEDAALEAELLADPKERAEHVMLVDLGRNDVGKVARPGSIALPDVMSVERYSHVMHISSTVTGELRDGLDCWDALRATLPVGTISGAPKIRAMQIIDELEAVRRGPYGGGIGWASIDGQMDIALALRTIVVPTEQWDGQRWTYHVQAAGGIVADSQHDAEYQETVNKAAALGRAIDLAEHAFAAPARPTAPATSASA